METLIAVALIAGALLFFAGLARMGFAVGLLFFVLVALLLMLVPPLGLVAALAIALYGFGEPIRAIGRRLA